MKLRGLRSFCEMWRPGHASPDPYMCARGHITTWLNSRQGAAIEAHRNPLCRCGLQMLCLPASPVLEGRLRDALRNSVKAIKPGPAGLARINNRIGGPGGRGRRQRRQGSQTR